MTHIIAKDLDKNSVTHNLDTHIPVTILDCPPLTVFGIRAYVNGYNGLEALTEIFFEKLDKDLARAMQIPKEVKNADKEKKIEESMAEIIKFVLLIHTQPKKSGIGKKTPGIMEVGIGGDVAAQWAYAKEILGKDISIKDVFNESDLIDTVAVTTGKGFQGPVKRWGIKIQKRKAKRAGHMRHVGSIGGWKPANVSWLTPMAGQMGYHNRVDFNKFLIKIGEKGEEINPVGGLIGYGLVKGEYILVKGSVPGPKKRAIALRKAIRPSKATPSLAIDYVSLVSQQGT
jgi:large subunit ribosomal protein L3